MADVADALFAHTTRKREMFVLNCADGHREQVLMESSEQLTQAAERCAMRIGSCHAETQPIDVARLQKALRTAALGRVVLRAAQPVPSTQDMLRGDPLRAPFYPGVVACAPGQTSARGRAGAKWITTRDALAFSVECRVPAVMAPFSQYVAALAVADALHPSLRVKWPNDVLATGQGRRKIAGVLCEGALRGNEAAIVVGIGVNLREAAFGGAALSDVDIAASTDPTHVLANILNALEPLLLHLTEHGFDGHLANRYYAKWIHNDQKVALDDERGAVARIVGIAPNGCVRVQRVDGSLRDCPPDISSLDLSAEVGVLKAKCQAL